MSRSKKEWCGKTDDSMPHGTVRRRIYSNQGGRCALCTRLLKTGNIALDHTVALEDGGENREANLQMICTSPCHKQKTGEENSRRAKADRVMKKHLGIKRSGPPMPGSRASKWKRRLDGTVVRREDNE